MMAADPLVSLLADLVAIPSVNPMGRGKSGPAYSEAALAAHVAAYLQKHGVDNEIDEFAPGRPNVIGTIDAGAEQTLLLEAHLDTVPAENMAIPPFTPEIRDGRLFGRGACDTKGSLAAFLHACCSVLGKGRRLRFNILLLAVADEEYQFTGAVRAVARGLKADFGIAGEPTRLHIVRAHKGVTRWRMVTRGVAAHSAYPERGENAIYRMGHVLSRLEEHALSLRAAAPHPGLGSPSLSVGVIEGGEVVNIVPDRCVIEVDRRTIPGESTESVLAAVTATLRDVPGWEMERPHLVVGAMEVSHASPIVGYLSDAVNGETGNVVVESAQYATDAGIYTGAGIPSVVFGPGDIAKAHTGAESIDLAELHAAAAIITRVIT
jgi:acetylornithine deacetylase